ncbi:putative deoxyribonuclease RhsB, partial [Clarias magur]
MIEDKFVMAISRVYDPDAPKQETPARFGGSSVSGGQHSGELGRCWVVKWGQVAGTAGALKDHCVTSTAEGQRT